MPNDLPIWDIAPAIEDHLIRGNRLVLIAPTGSGKSTQVPQILLNAGLAGDGKIIILQPRRVAARSLAARVAYERRCPLGSEVGYQIRFDDQTGLGTRICFVTEGILIRWLQDNRNLAGISAILFDEFHERNLLSDVALALVKRLQSQQRPDLKLVVMSATLEAEPVAAYLDHCPILASEGQMFPVEVNFLKVPDRRPVPEQAADAVANIVNSGAPGDILVFMPGMGEINATLNALRAARTSERLTLLPLHGDLPPEIQDQAFAPQTSRKIVVATNVAETSITIDGIRHVVDGGLARVARYDAERGIGTLFIEEISRASADQRKGRAGRTAPGTCHRLWTESGHLNRAEANTPEIQRTDLAEVVLLLHALHIPKASAFDWLDKPDPIAVDRAETLLRMLGALEPSSGELTPVGHQMRRLPMHPRFSRMLVEASHRGCVRSAALCAALVSGRDLLVRLGREDKHVERARESLQDDDTSDFFPLIKAFQLARDHRFDLDACRRYGIHAQTARQVAQTWQQINQIAAQQKLLLPDQPESESALSLRQCLMTGFIDQLCRRRDQGSLECLLTEGRTGTLMRESVIQKAPLFVAASIREVSARGSSALTLLGLATAVELDWLRELFPQHLQLRAEHVFDRTHKRVAALRQLYFQDLLLQQEHLRDMDPAACGRCLAEAHRAGLFELPLFNHEIRQFVARVQFVNAVAPELEFPVMNEAAIIDCLARAFTGCALAKEAQKLPLRESFLGHLAREQVEWLNELAPTTLLWPDGRKLKVLYPETPPAKSEPSPAPEIQIKLHECFALTQHPTLCEGKVPVKLWLCAPDGKRLDSTQDWFAFKTTGYPKLKPALSKKYPGMVWL